MPPPGGGSAGDRAGGLARAPSPADHHEQLVRPSFSLLPLGTGGGPLETDLSAYLVKPASSPWAHGCISLEAGSGIGALAELLGRAEGGALWTQFGLDDELAGAADPGAAWKAGRVMQTVRAYLVTHAHLDHVLSLILGSGGLPPPKALAVRPPGASEPDTRPAEPPWSSTRAVYGSLETLVNLQSAFEERIWPDIGGFERGEHGTKIVRFLEITPTAPVVAQPAALPNGPSSAAGRTLRSRRPPSPDPSASSPPSVVATGSPLLHPGPSSSAQPSPAALPPAASTSLLPADVQNQVYTPLPTSPPLSVLAFPISHGTCSSARRRGSRIGDCCGGGLARDEPAAKGTKRMRKDAVPGEASRADGAAEASGEQEPLATYEASVFFVRSDERIPERPSETRRREFCFFGDVEPDSISLNPRNRRVWEEVAYRFQAGILDSVFIECSYDDSRPDHLLYGHLTPRHVLAELAVLHGLLRPSTSATPVDPSASSPPPQLKGLKVYIIHVKETLESLAADRGGVRGRVWRELEAGKKSFAGGILRDVEFVVVNKGESLLF